MPGGSSQIGPTSEFTWYSWQSLLGPTSGVTWRHPYAPLKPASVPPGTTLKAVLAPEVALLLFSWYRVQCQLIFNSCAYLGAGSMPT